jgi:hypothetical protein
MAEEDWRAVYSPPGTMTVTELAQLIMRQEGWGWSRALHEAMTRREAAARRTSRLPRRQGRGGDGGGRR